MSYSHVFESNYAIQPHKLDTVDLCSEEPVLDETLESFVQS